MIGCGPFWWSNGKENPVRIEEIMKDKRVIANIEAEKGQWLEWAREQQNDFF